MTEPRANDADDLADYTDRHETKPAPDPAVVERAETPDVAEQPATEPPD